LPSMSAPGRKVWGMETSTEDPARPESGPAVADRTPPAPDAPPGAAADAADAAAVSGAAALPPASLSPSRASDFMQCPLLYRLRVSDRLPEKPSEAATRGTLVHGVLERLFDAPAAERTAPRAKALLPGQWERLRESRPEVEELFAEDLGGGGLARGRAGAGPGVARART